MTDGYFFRLSILLGRDYWRCKRLSSLVLDLGAARRWRNGAPHRKEGAEQSLACGRGAGMLQASLDTP